MVIFFFKIPNFPLLDLPTFLYYHQVVKICHTKKNAKWHNNDPTNCVNGNHSRKLDANVSHNGWWKCENMA
jgi:hypothetical protein